MKKKAAKIFKKYGEKKIEVLENYAPRTKEKKTTAIMGSRRDINHAIGNVILKANKEEQKLVAKALKETYSEDWDYKAKLVVKF